MLTHVHTRGVDCHATHLQCLCLALSGTSAALTKASVLASGCSVASVTASRRRRKSSDTPLHCECAAVLPTPACACAGEGVRDAVHSRPWDAASRSHAEFAD